MVGATAGAMEARTAKTINIDSRKQKRAVRDRCRNIICEPIGSAIFVKRWPVLSICLGRGLHDLARAGQIRRYCIWLAIGGEAAGNRQRHCQI
jgi:hypothetical protein